MALKNHSSAIGSRQFGIKPWGVGYRKRGIGYGAALDEITGGVRV